MHVLSFDDMLTAREVGAPVVISVARARHIVAVVHGLDDPSEFAGFMEFNAKSADSNVCAASLYEWLGY